MNSLLTREADVFKQTLALRQQLMEILTDSDLAYALPGNRTLGELCKEMGEAEQGYIESFQTFKHNFIYKHDASVATSIDALKAWYATLEATMMKTLESLSEDDINTTMIDRGFSVPIGVQLHIYREALLIFSAKASLYLRALGKPLPEQWQTWIG